MVRKSVSKFKGSGVKKLWMEKRKSLCCKDSWRESAKGKQVGTIPIFLFSIISNIGGIYYENKRLKQNCV